MAKGSSVKTWQVLNGRKETLLDAMKKINEVAVISVALFVLFSFQGISYVCPQSQYQQCYYQFLQIAGPKGEYGNVLDHASGPKCGDMRRECYRGLVQSQVGTDRFYTPCSPLFQQNTLFFQCCYC